MKRYLQINEFGYITDMISYPLDGYIEVDFDEYPIDFYAGFWKYINGQVILDEYMRTVITSSSIPIEE